MKTKQLVSVLVVLGFVVACTIKNDKPTLPESKVVVNKVGVTNIKPPVEINCRLPRPPKKAEYNKLSSEKQALVMAEYVEKVAAANDECEEGIAKLRAWHEAQINYSKENYRKVVTPEDVKGTIKK
jgi:hypothetical protein